MQRLRQLHLWLGVFFTPLIVLFAFSGVLQTFNFHESPKSGNYVAPAWIVTLAQIHKHQRLTRQPGTSSPLPLKIFVTLMSVGLIVTSLLGIYMAFRYERRHALLWAMIVTGAALPIALLFL